MVDHYTKAITLHQFGTDSADDLLYLFSAPAKILVSWAGVPRKGWRIRMLYQRWVTDARKNELAEFWTRAGNPQGDQRYILGPTAISIALQTPLSLEDDTIHLAYNSPIDISASPVNNIQKLAKIIAPKVIHRLSQDKQENIETFSRDPFSELPEVGHDYIYEFALQLTLTPIWIDPPVLARTDPPRF